jgi:membrane protease YdiL (CAAX protease family)
MLHPTNKDLASLRRVAADLFLFFFFAYAVSWSFWGCAIWLNLPVAPRRSELGRSVYFAGIQGPFLAAVTLSWIRGGTTAVRNLLLRLVRTPFNPIWLVVAVVIVPLIMLVAFGVAVIVDGAAVPRPLVVRPPMGWPMLIVGQLLVMNGEEYGWRGYALPQMAKLDGTLGSALLLGILWALWHVPLFYTAGA